MVQAVLRSAAGAVAGAVRMPAFVIPGLLRGAAPPSFTPQPSLKADAVPELPLQDVELVSLDGTKLHAVVDDGGKRVAGKRPIVFVHGYPDGWFCYVPQLGHFIDLGHPVLALSMRGYGASDKPEGIAKYHLFDCLAQDVRAAVNHMRALAKPLLVAHDCGRSALGCYSRCSRRGVAKIDASQKRVSSPLPTQTPVTALPRPASTSDLCLHHVPRPHPRPDAQEP